MYIDSFSATYLYKFSKHFGKYRKTANPFYKKKALTEVSTLTRLEIV